MTNNTDVPIWEKYTLTIEESVKILPYRGKRNCVKLAEEKSRRWLGDCEWKPCAD